MDWFQHITGFKELDYSHTREKLRIEEGRLYSSESANDFVVGELELPSLSELRKRVAPSLMSGSRTKVRNLFAGVHGLGELESRAYGA